MRDEVSLQMDRPSSGRPWKENRIRASGHIRGRFDISLQVLPPNYCSVPDGSACEATGQRGLPPLVPSSGTQLDRAGTCTLFGKSLSTLVA